MQQAQSVRQRGVHLVYELDAFTNTAVHVAQTAYTAVWIAISSELGYYKELYGPQILLQVPSSSVSLPLLLRLEAGHFGRILSGPRTHPCTRPCR